MAEKITAKGGAFLARFIVAIVLGVFGYLIGVLLEGTNIFPESLELGAIFLFLGFVAGMFLDKISEYLDNVF